MSTSMLTDGWVCDGGAGVSMLTEGWFCPPAATGMVGYPQIRGSSDAQGSPAGLGAVMLAMDASSGVEDGKGSRVTTCVEVEGASVTQALSARSVDVESGKGSATKVTTSSSSAAKTTTKVRG